MVCLIYGASKIVVKDEQKDLRQYQTLEMVEFQVFISLLAWVWFKDNLGKVEQGVKMTDEDEEFYHILSQGRVFNSDMLIHMLTKLLKTIELKCINFDDIKKQQE